MELLIRTCKRELTSSSKRESSNICKGIRGRQKTKWNGCICAIPCMYVCMYVCINIYIYTTLKFYSKDEAALVERVGGFSTIILSCSIPPFWNCLNFVTQFLLNLCIWNLLLSVHTYICFKAIVSISWMHSRKLPDKISDLKNHHRCAPCQR
jgi:hypothetical protein